MPSSLASSHDISKLISNPTIFLARTPAEGTANGSSVSACKTDSQSLFSSHSSSPVNSTPSAPYQIARNEIFLQSEKVFELLEKQEENCHFVKSLSQGTNLDLNSVFELMNLIDLKSLERKLKSASKRVVGDSKGTVQDVLLLKKRPLMSAKHNIVSDDDESMEEEEDSEESDLNDDQEGSDASDAVDEQDLQEYTEPLSENDDDDDGSGLDETIFEEEDEDQEHENIPTSHKERLKKKSVVDDDFFSLEEMEHFAELSEARDIKMANKLAKKTNDDDQDSDEDEEDMFSIGKDLATGEFDFDLGDEDEEEGDNANDIRYEDFFVSKTDKDKGPRRNWRDEMADEKKMESSSTDFTPEIINGQDADQEDTDPPMEDLLEEQEDEQEPVEELSVFEKRQQRMQEKINKFEKENMAEKEWTMKGEVSAKARPVNSLLEQDLDVEIAAKPVPIITEDTTKTIGELIIQRIKDRAYDDVVRKAPPKDSVYDPNRRWELDDEKSKKSLGEIYEDEYRKKVMNAEIKSERTVKMEASHKEITDLMTNLFQNLDALSNFHYTPPPAELELEVIPAASVPAISMEEIIPAHVSSASLATPHDVFSGRLEKSQIELEKSEKTNLRRKAKRKAAQEKRGREAVKKAKVEQGGTMQQMSKQKAIHSLMGQKNVTLVVGAQKKGGAAAAVKGRKRATLASTVREGEAIGPAKPSFTPSMLKL